MAYKINPHGPIRDKMYPSEIAAARPVSGTKYPCALEDSDNLETNHEETESRCERFNRQLREGQQQINQDD